ncbi:MAG: FtsW/RodA/SpoVE family cell cycle protein [Chloroflexota bacterium]
MRAIQSRLLILAAACTALYAVALTLSPAARARSWDVPYRWDHWLGWLIWAAVFAALHRQSNRRLTAHDPYLIPILSLLSGWGLLTIWRLYPAFGMRQAIWLLVCGGVFTLGLRFVRQLEFLRRYKYVWFTAGLLLTALTLIFGTNPMGFGPRLWLGCCGVYFQPSEPLKLLLIVYLAAYLAERLSMGMVRPALPLLAPTFVMTSLALALMLAQRDLGTASILLFLYAAVVYVATGHRRFLLFSSLAIGAAALLGYALFDVVRLRVDAWLNPWIDPSGRSYQIVQSLLAVANGGVFGRGPGMGSPSLVPVAHSDFIFAAIAEETGLAGSIALIGLLLVLVARGLRLALYAGDAFRQILAAGLTAYLAAQSVLIIGGNLRLLPLTGVTLPLVSYGGSSLLVSFLCLFLLVKIGEASAPAAETVDEDRAEETAGRFIERNAAPRTHTGPQPYFHLAGFLFAGLFATALATGWWAYWRGPALLTRTDNLRRSLADRFVRRGALLDRSQTVLVESSGPTGELARQYRYPLLGPLLGYTHPVYGQAGLEASLDDYLRGLQGNSGLSIWWNHLLYGQPPAGLDVRLSLDLDLQRITDDLLGQQAGAVVLINAENGEILALASHPTFDANQLDQQGESLLADPTSPLFNRATLGLYPAQAAVNALWQGIDAGQPLPSLAEAGLYTAPLLRLPTASGASQEAILRASPLQMALLAATVSGGGVRPAPDLVLAVDTPQAGWVLLPPLGQSQVLLDRQTATSLADQYREDAFWQRIITAGDGTARVTWYLGGTLPGWQGAPLTVAVLIESADPAAAAAIGRGVLDAAVK